MSTILQALQKNKLAQAGRAPAIAQPPATSSPWKIALTLALLTIIVLLSVLIYLILNPNNVTPPTAVVAIESVKQSNNAVKISFDTQPLPRPSPAIKKEGPAIEITSSNIVTEVAQLPEEVVSVEITPLDSEEIQQPLITQQQVEYEDVPSDLKERFKLAVLLEDMEKNDGIAEEITYHEEVSDGSNIREMSGNFQDKVPLIHYDSHVYSSIAADRWIRINGEVLAEGDTDSSGLLELVEIQPQRSIFRLERQSFSIESLEDWKGY